MTELNPSSRQFVDEIRDDYEKLLGVVEIPITLKDSKGKLIFPRGSIKMPNTWTSKAAFIFATKYLKCINGAWEGSVFDPVDRVCRSLTGALLKRIGINVQTPSDVISFHKDLFGLLIEQKVSFNSPVWFNLGTDERGFLSACFIMSIGDSIQEIYQHLADEAQIFKWGSGNGKDWSTVRSSWEELENGGQASGPLSFMKAFDASAGVIKSGGRHRRAAKMDILSVYHPDILKTSEGGIGFIGIKVQEDDKAKILAEAGYSTRFDDPNNCYSGSWYQNSNTAIKVFDDFMTKAVSGDLVTLNAVTTGKAVHTVKAEELLEEIAKSVWACGDPGLYFYDTINNWHTCPNTAPINACNPCAEYVFIDNSSCNLASHNLRKYIEKDKNTNTWSFDAIGFADATKLMISAMDLVVDLGSYPTEQIEQNSRNYRPLGLGFANLGGILMSMGVGYNTNVARYLAKAITSLMTAAAYTQSAELARDFGPFEGYAKNREPMLKVIDKYISEHGALQYELQSPILPGIEANCINMTREIASMAHNQWIICKELGEKYGYRNSQATLIAPTGTIRLGMDCDTGGIEPLDGLRTIKYMVDGGTMAFTPDCIKEGLETLGYNNNAINQAEKWIEEHNTLEGCPILNEWEVSVFATALGPSNTISPEGHVLMMAAVQPFLSGAISKTVNLPAEYTVDNIKQAIVLAWKSGIKTITFYRDGSKMIQPIRPKTQDKTESPKEELPNNKRKRLPQTRPSSIQKFQVEGHEGYAIFGEYDDGSLGEVFVVCSKMGSTIQGLLNQWATQISISLQHGTPLATIIAKERHVKYDPSGWTDQDHYRSCTSITDLIAEMMERRYLRKDSQEMPETTIQPQQSKPKTTTMTSHSKPCSECGNLMQRTGTCYTCPVCGLNSGCS